MQLENVIKIDEEFRFLIVPELKKVICSDYFLQTTQRCQNKWSQGFRKYTKMAENETNSVQYKISKIQNLYYIKIINFLPDVDDNLKEDKKKAALIHSIQDIG